MNDYAKLYGIGVGPGDPDLMTLKAIKTIENSEAVVLPSSTREKCYAYKIVSQIIPTLEEKNLLFCDFPMTKDRSKLERAHDAIAARIEEQLQHGKSVAFLTIGDPAIYSTYTYIDERIRQRGYDTEMVSGVPSFCAVAAALGISLGDKNEEIHIIPASYAVEESLKLSGTKIYMKSGQKLKELKKALLNPDFVQTNQMVYCVSDCGLSTEKRMYGVENLDTDAGYLTIVIVKHSK